MALYKRPNGKIVEVNDTPGSYEYVEYLGWVRQSDKPTPAEPAEDKPKRKRRTKAQMAEDK